MIDKQPGLTIIQQMNNKEMYISELALIMNIPEIYIHKLLRGEIVVSEKIAETLEIVFNINKNNWLELEKNKIFKKS